MPTPEQELLDLSHKLIASIVAGDWAAYANLCDPTLTCLEPEARGHLIGGLAFHKFYFDLGGAAQPRTTTLAEPHVRMLGSDAAVVSYIRVTQLLDGNGVPKTTTMEETRVWQRIGGKWQHVHFHRSPPG